MCVVCALLLLLLLLLLPLFLALVLLWLFFALSHQKWIFFSFQITLFTSFFSHIFLLYHPHAQPSDSSSTNTDDEWSDQTKNDVDALMKELYSDDEQEDEEEEEDPPGSYVTTLNEDVRPSAIFRLDFEFADDVGDDGISCLLTMEPRDIRRLQRFSHLTKMNAMSTSAIAGQMYHLTTMQNQLTDLNYFDWVDQHVSSYLRLPGEQKWVKEGFHSLFSILERDEEGTIELSDIVTSLTSFTKGSIEKFELAFQLYGALLLLLLLFFLVLLFFCSFCPYPPLPFRSPVLTFSPLSLSLSHTHTHTLTHSCTDKQTKIKMAA